MINKSSYGKIALDTQVIYYIGANPFCVQVNDLDKDGKPELITANGSPYNSFGILKNLVPFHTSSFSIPIAKVKLISNNFLKDKLINETVYSTYKFWQNYLSLHPLQLLPNKLDNICLNK